MRGTTIVFEGKDCRPVASLVCSRVIPDGTVRSPRWPYGPKARGEGEEGGRKRRRRERKEGSQGDRTGRTEPAMNEGGSPACASERGKDLSKRERGSNAVWAWEARRRRGFSLVGAVMVVGSRHPYTVLPRSLPPRLAFRLVTPPARPPRNAWAVEAAEKEVKQAQ